MTDTRRLPRGVLLLVALSLALGALAVTLPEVQSGLAHGADGGGAADDSRAPAESLSRIFRRVFRSVSPSVVSISSVRRLEAQAPRGPSAPQPPQGVPPELRDFFGEDLLERFFRDRPPRPGREQRGLGTGVIVDADGHILTNNHVVAGADEVEVTLAEGRRFAAEVLGTDPKSDLAVLEIDAGGLDAVPFGDSDATEVGDWVLAIGDPFGLSMTLTAGIVSAKGRSGVGIADYEDFLQTDAAINPGNSGGPLVNLRGEVVGINTAIASRTGGNMGIGFAIPSSMARRVLEQILAHGRVTRGWLGVYIQNLDERLARSFGYGSTDGALVGDVVQGGPAERAGLRSGDIVTRFAGDEVEGISELRNLVADARPGSSLEIEVFRDGDRRALEVEVGELEEDGHRPLGDAPEAGSAADVLGLEVRTLTPEEAQRLGYSASEQGVVVAGVEPGSLADAAGLRPDDVIVQVDGQQVASAEDLRGLVTSEALADGVRLSVEREGYQRFVFIQGPGPR